MENRQKDGPMTMTEKRSNFYNQFLFAGFPWVDSRQPFQA